MDCFESCDPLGIRIFKRRQFFYFLERIWPCALYNIPYDVFSPPYDTITELPKSSKQEEKIEVNVEGNGVAEGN